MGFFLQVLLFWTANVWAGPDTTSSFLDAMYEARATPEFHSFLSDDGTKISYAAMGLAGPKGPLVISEGKGESAYRWLEFAAEMGKRGYGPIYSIDHRGQGFSEGGAKGAVHVENFEKEYVSDFLKFVKGPVKEDLLRRGITAKPNIVAHSMGGGVAELALRREPQIAGKIAYVAPMFGINMGNTMNRLGDKPVEFVTGLMSTVGLGRIQFGPSPDQMPEFVPGKASSRLRGSYAIEKDLGIYNRRQTVSWLNQSLRAGDRITDSPGKPEIAWILPVE